MSLDFHPFGKAVRDQFNKLAAVGSLFTVASDRDTIVKTYLEAFPEGSNPMYRQKSEHDCSCCKHFIRGLGNVVSIKDGNISTVWDVTGLPEAYQIVADAMAKYIRSCKIDGLFVTKFPSAGQEFTREMVEGVVKRWEHFSGVAPSQYVSHDPGEKIGKALAAHDVLRRGILELSPGAVATVIDLIENNQLYKGAEFLSSVKAFQALQTKILALRDLSIDVEPMFWEFWNAPASKMKNTAIGTLVENLSSGMGLEDAVKAFETIVAPQNYRRSSSLITPRMVESAMKTITELGLEAAFHRRHARLSDVSVTNVLWVDGSVQSKMKGGLQSLLMEEVKPAAFDPNNAKPIGIEEFLRLPHKNGIRLFVSNDLTPNFVSMTAPVHPEPKRLFKWDNDFAWSYEGNVTDSIKEKVKRAGGKVEGVALRCSLAWYNFNDLDLHCYSPDGRIYYGFKNGVLDVDMNAGGPSSRTPVENMRWVTPPNGTYRFVVNNYARREMVDVGFEIEVESALGIHTFRYDKDLANKEDVEVCTVVVKNGKVTEVRPANTQGLILGARSQEVWGLKTLDLVKVQSIVLSPNCWDGKVVGNKHWFFILEGCKNPNPCRGVYNEYLHPRLDVHRKVFEVLGDKLKCPVADEQLSGVGFSSTRKDKVIAVSGGISYAVQF